MGTGFAKKKKQARQLQAQMSMLQESLSSKLDTMEAEGTAGNGLVSITVSGSGEIKRVRINPDCVDKEDIAGLEALVKAAHTDAFKKVQEVAESAPKLENLFGM